MPFNLGLHSKHILNPLNMHFDPVKVSLNGFAIFFGIRKNLFKGIYRKYGRGFVELPWISNIHIWQKVVNAINLQ